MYVFSNSFSPVTNAQADRYFCVEEVYDDGNVDCDDGNHYNSSVAYPPGPYSFSRPLYAMAVVVLFLGVLLTLVSTVAGAYNAFRQEYGARSNLFFR